jgi:hypothetical protein
MALIAFDIANSFVSPGPDAVFLAAALQASKVGGKQTVKTVTKELLGNNPRITRARTNTDLPGGKATAKSIFRNQTKGQKIEQFDLPKGGVRREAGDRTNIRFNPDGTTRLDLPNRGPNPPGRETIHFGP